MLCKCQEALNNLFFGYQNSCRPTIPILHHQLQHCVVAYPQQTLPNSMAPWQAQTHSKLAIFLLSLQCMDAQMTCKLLISTSCHVKPQSEPFSTRPPISSCRVYYQLYTYYSGLVKNTHAFPKLSCGFWMQKWRAMGL